MRLIDVDKLTTEIKREYCEDCIDDACDLCWVIDCIKYLKNAPTVEAKPIKHGHWITGTEPFPTYQCSNCKEYADEAYDYCPECGAKMDEVEPHKDCCDYLDESCNCRLEDGQCNYQPLCDVGDCSMCVK